MSDAAEIADLAARIRERDELERTISKCLREADKVIAPLINNLPSSQPFLLADQAVAAWRIIRDENPDLYLTYSSFIRSKCGPNIEQIVLRHIGPPATSNRRTIELLTVAQLIARPEPAMLVDGMLPRRGFGVVYGESGSGKTFFVLHVSDAVSRAVECMGRPTDGGGVIYIAAEGRLRERIAALQAHHGLATEDMERLLIIEQAVDLSGQTKDADELVRCVSDGVERLGSVSLVIIDTVARVMAGADENSGKDMGAFIAAARRIEDACEGLVLAVHHSGKDRGRGARGHSSLRAATDVELEVTREESGARVVTVTKQRDGADGEAFGFRLEPCPPSCVVVPIAAPAKVQAAKRLTANDRLALEALRDEIRCHGEAVSRTSVLPGGTVARVEGWRARFYAALGGSEERDNTAKRQAFYRARTNLSAQKIIGIHGEFVWIWRA